MARIQFAVGVTDDIERIAEHLIEHEASDVAGRIQDIVRAIDVLEYNPLIGRPVERGKHELVIGRRARGYIALYVYISEIDTIFVLALRRQTEAGFEQG